MNQKTLSFTVSRLPGETAVNHVARQRRFNVEDEPQKIPPEKLFADLLKRQARLVMLDVTDCPADMVPVHLARLDFLRELISHAIRHELLPVCETRLTGRQLLYAYTVADFLACLEITRKTHRAPAYLNQRDADIAQINRKLDLLAGLFARSPALNEVLSEAIAADESEVGL